MFARTIDLLGQEGHDRLRESLVVVIGLGGVGSHVVTAMARAGIRRIRVVDADVVTRSSLNRHATAVAADVGRPKTEVLEEWLIRLDPEIEVEAMQEFAAAENFDSLLRGEPDMVIDAIDSVGPKTDLLAFCVINNLPVISCMGASSRTDPTKIIAADIAESVSCPLARRVRKGLRKRGVVTGITVVFSTEKPLQPLPPDEFDATLVRGRIRNRQPSLSTLPGIFGYTIANAAIMTLCRFGREEPIGGEG